MNDLSNYISNTVMRNTQDWHPYDEALLMMLNVLATIIMEGDDTLIITDAQILGVRAGEITEYMEIGDHERACKEAKAQHKPGLYTSFRDAMRLSVEHDERIRQHFQLIEELPSSVTYRIIQDPAAGA